MALVISSAPKMNFRGTDCKTTSVNSCAYVRFSRLHSMPINSLYEATSNKVYLGQNSDILCYSWPRFPYFESHMSARNSANRVVLNAYIGEDSSKSNIYSRLNSCLIIPPSKGNKPCAIIKFLGGAFIGAVPEATYSYLMTLLAKEQFLVISVPYSVTFDHARAATEVYERFNACLDLILASGLPNCNLNVDDLVQLPIFSVGHSNGALLQLLIGSYFSEKIPKANVIISYNNRPAAEAVPYFEQFGPIISQLMPIVEANPLYAMARTVSGDALKVLIDMAGGLIQDQDAVASVAKFVDQLPSVMNQVTQGTSEFKPSPSENRDFCKKSYNVPHTLLVKFEMDTIDESDLLEGVLKPRVNSFGGTLEKVTLAGNHLTPCIQDIKWKVGDVYTPADALAQGLKSLSLNDTRLLAMAISSWLKDRIQK